MLFCDDDATPREEGKASECGWGKHSDKLFLAFRLHVEEAQKAKTSTTTAAVAVQRTASTEREGEGEIASKIQTCASIWSESS